MGNFRGRIRSRNPFFTIKWLPDAIGVNRIHVGSTTPATFLASDPCGSMWRIHAKCWFLWVGEGFGNALIKILKKARPAPDPGTLGAAPSTSDRLLLEFYKGDRGRARLAAVFSDEEGGGAFAAQRHTTLSFSPAGM